MKVLALLGHSRARHAVRLAMPRWGRGSRAVVPRFLTSWEELLREAGGSFQGAVIVDPFFGVGTGDSLGEIERLRSVLGVGGIVLYSAPCRKWTETLHELSILGFPIHLTQGVDDHPSNLLRSLAAAVSSRRVPVLVGGLEGLGVEAYEMLGEVLSHWPRAESVPVLARNLKESERNLRRKLKRSGLACPCSILRALSLLDAKALKELGVSSVSRLASLLGYEGPWSIRRCFGSLTGEALDDLLDEGGDDRLTISLARVLRRP